MKTKVFVIILSLLIPAVLFCMKTGFSGIDQGVPFNQVRGDTDAYGYYSMEDTDPGGPTYNWKDTTSAWTKVNGLGDDNNVGTFPIGFDFPYYWYKVNQFWVNSNGCISFSDAEVYMPQAFSGIFIPSTNPPNDIVIPLGADLTFERDPDSGSVWYYTNNVDTLIVSYLDVPTWTGPDDPEGSHYFQLILCKTDSTILFQYNHQHGSFYQGTNCGGIEDVIGDVGVSAFWKNCPDSGSAIKFFPPVSTTYQALDVGVHECMSPNSEGIFIFPNLGFVPWATIRNQGNVDAGSFDVSCLIFKLGGTIQFTDTLTIPALTADSDTTVHFTCNHPDSGWFPGVADDYFALVTTSLALDINPTNNVRDCEIIAITIPGWLVYDSNPGSGSHPPWFTPDGWVQEFVPPCYPMVIDSVMLALMSDTTADIPILFMDDDGPNGGPGTILFSDSVNVPGGAFWDWYTISIPPSVNTITSGAFYVGMIEVNFGWYPSVFMEDTGPFSRRSWTYEGSSWSPFRERNIWELLIRAHTSTTGISEGKDKTEKAHSLSLLPVSPNPLKGNTKIFYSLPNDVDVTLKVYNILGQEVRTLVDNHQKPGIHSVSFDAKDSRGNALPQGVYFYRLNVGNNSLTKKITLIR